jgi:4-amino-4-deoxy-L-arabinose transferase-like glycosyltransferase
MALVLRAVLFFGGVRGADAYAYAHHAYNIAVGQYDVTADAMSYGFRYTVLLPAALAYKLFGVGDWSSALFPLLASLATVWMVIRLGTLWLGKQAGLIAGLLYATYPLDLPWATLLGPDSFIPALSAGAVLGFWLAGEETRPERHRTGLYTMSGLCIGLAAQARESGLLLLPVLGVLAWSRPSRLRIIGTILAGCFAPFLLELAYYWVMVGNPIHKIAVLEKLNALYVGGRADGPTSLTYYPRAMFGMDLEGLAWYGLFTYAALGALAVAMWTKELPRLTPLLVWILPPLLYLEFGSLSVSRYAPVSKSYPYLTIISIPVVLACAYGLARALDLGSNAAAWLRTVWRSAAVAAIALLVLTSLYGTYRLLENFKDDARPFEVVASAVQTHPEQPIYVPHDRWALLLNYHLGYRTGFNYYAQTPAGSARLKDLRELKQAAPDLPAYVVLHDRYLFYDTAGRPVERADVPDLVRRPPASWRVVVQEQAKPAYNSFTLYETEPRPAVAPGLAVGTGADAR